MPGEVLLFDPSKRRKIVKCEECRFFKKVELFAQARPIFYRLCGARPFPKKPDSRGVMRPWRRAEADGAGYFIRDEELAYERCWLINKSGRCAGFRQKFPDRFTKEKRLA
ncbi:MAG: hypothetical protein HYW15_00955 [Candidatus Giovannonibacteria bacterium]|nr:MAG: hypothetical protein HYW15_00955 [Candidatus Giovannonibacteria bacterium]